MSKTVKTGISQAYWSKLDGTRAKFEPAQEQAVDKSLHTICHLDELLNGGLRIDDKSGQPTTILIAGPPGSGKSTLALELCYRLAIRPEKDVSISCYISTEMAAEQVLEKATNFHWPNAENIISTEKRPSPKPNPGLGQIFVPSLHVESSETNGTDSNKHKWISDSVINMLDLGIKLAWFVDPHTAPILAPTTSFIKVFRDWVRRRSGDDQAGHDQEENPLTVRADVVVVDSLNTLSPDDKEDYFAKFCDKAVENDVKILIFILDSASERNSVTNQYAPWAYLCDYVINMNSDSSKRNYTKRTIEIVKARYHEHVLGLHQFKIYTGSEPRATEMNDLEVRNVRRAHPYRHEGGLFVFPSIHYYLSKYKRSAPITNPTFTRAFPDGLDAILDTDTESGNTGEKKHKDLPEGRCIAFVGNRGGHKSHLGYLNILERLKKGESALIVSLRDDEEMCKEAMYSLLKYDFGIEDLDERKEKILEYEKLDRLEILYYPPGYITPEEFYHRMLISVLRMKDSKRPAKLTVLFNSLDQLAARFPLCADEDVFIPGIISSLSGENVSSIFVAVDEISEPGKQYGLIPMADLILKFRRWRCSQMDYIRILTGDRIDAETAKHRDEFSQLFDQKVLLTVDRFAGGQMAGSSGILEQLRPGDFLHRDGETTDRRIIVDIRKRIYEGKSGLHFLPLVPGMSPRFPGETWVE